MESLGLEQMPTAAHFRRDHFPIPAISPADWRLTVSGCVGRPLELTLTDLARYPAHELSVVLECAGHRRSELRPAVEGLPWGIGAVSEAVWSGTSLAHLLSDVEVRDGRFVVLEGADRGPFGGSDGVPFARAVPLEKALDADTMLAWRMNGAPLPIEHGAPVRVVVPGWYATDSVKWVTRISIVDRPFEGPFETETYRLSPAPTGRGARMTALPVHSLITSVTDGTRIACGAHTVNGIAWGGTRGIRRVEVSVDGAPWREAKVAAAASAYGRRRWHFDWHADAGMRTLAVRATDGDGASQPLEPYWNEGGYANASVQKVRVVVTRSDTAG
jgi:DMSO/TMAO reductase YedYZ molybdopterin-dependent catalytic subunit